MVYKMTAIKELFERARLVESINRPAASADKAPACGCLPVFGYKKLVKKVSRTLKSIYHRPEPQLPVKHLTQQTDGVALEIQVLMNGDVKCSLSVVEIQLNNQPASGDVASTTCSCTNSEVKPLKIEPDAEPHQEDIGGINKLGSIAVYASCDVVLTDTATLHSKSNGIRMYPSKLANWCKTTLHISRANDATISDVGRKEVNRWGSSSSNSRRNSLMKLSSASNFVSFRKSNGSSSSA